MVKSICNKSLWLILIPLSGCSSNGHMTADQLFQNNLAKAQGSTTGTVHIPPGNIAPNGFVAARTARGEMFHPMIGWPTATMSSAAIAEDNNNSSSGTTGTTGTTETTGTTGTTGSY